MGVSRRICCDTKKKKKKEKEKEKDSFIEDISDDDDDLSLWVWYIHLARGSKYQDAAPSSLPPFTFSPAQPALCTHFHIFDPRDG